MRALISLAVLSMLATTAFGQLATPNENGLTYGHVHLNVSDMDEHKRIWVEHFNATIVERGPLTVAKLPNMMVALTDRAPTMGSRATKMDHFGFKVRDMARFLDKWRADGLGVGRIFPGAEGQTNAYVFLPDDIVVEMQEDQGLQQEITGYHIHFITPDHEELLQWYVDMFDLEIRPRGSIATTTNVPGMNLSFGGTDQDRQPTQGTGIDHIGFEIDNLEEFCRTLEAKGVVFDVPYREIPAIGLNIAYFTDPAGIYVELTEGYDGY
ncbi:MAG TPA: VOC family protein [Gammaproteobacteria bacterium]|nr:VOC family protein [Gammaproteobacteria bacterium]